MHKSGFRWKLFVTLFVASTVLALPTSPASANAPTLTRINAVRTSHIGGSALFGATVPAAMAASGPTALPTPYSYGPYTEIWNLSNPSSKRIDNYQIAFFQCDDKSGADALNVNPNAPGCVQISSTFETPSRVERATTAVTFLRQFGSPGDHGKWLRTSLRIIFDDRTELRDWAPSLLYLDASVTNDVPVASTRGANGQSVPQNTAMTMAFNGWQGTQYWKSRGLLSTRSAVVYQCPVLPSDTQSAVVPTSTTPAGCTRLVTNNAFDTAINSVSTLSFTTGAKDTYIYAIDTLSVLLNQAPSASPVVQLQKRSIYTTYDPAELPNGPSPSGGVVVPPGATVDPLQGAGINTTTAPVVSTTGKVTANGVTAVIESNRRYQRGTQRRTLRVRIQPNNKSQGTIVAALVSKGDVVDTVHLTKTKRVRNGKTQWRWRFSSSLPRGRYTLYVSFTPTDTAIAPMTITKRVRLR